jgi:hypothetical protein
LKIRWKDEKQKNQKEVNIQSTMDNSNFQKLQNILDIKKKIFWIHLKEKKNIVFDSMVD